MAHAAPPPPSQQRRSAVVGAFLLIVGLAVAVLAVYGLNKPKGHQASKDTGTAAVVATSAKPSATGSAAKTSAPAKTSSPATSTSTKATPGSSSATPTTPSASSFGVVVVNNNPDDSGIALAAAAEFKAKGWTISGDPTNWGDPNAILSNCVYYDPNVTGSQAAAEKLQSEFPGIERVEMKFPGLPDGPLVVALTNSID
jgi:hypothetical protein